VYRQLLQQASECLADGSVLELQLLLLARQAKQQNEALAGAEHERLSAVPKLIPSNLQQQQQQSDGLHDKLVVPPHHELLLEEFLSSLDDLKDAEIAALEQQQLAILPHIR
jgi:hypothetical protein